MTNKPQQTNSNSQKEKENYKHETSRMDYEGGNQGDTKPETDKEDAGSEQPKATDNKEQETDEGDLTRP